MNKFEKFYEKDHSRLKREEITIKADHPIIGNAMVKYRNQMDDYMLARRGPINMLGSPLRDYMYPRVRKAMTGNRYPWNA
ncbi:MAG: hypothetical protein IJM91_07480 [Lachnospiraceae bacterium]|nr:hypothetical protein [Lachnospiraceae bacterium]